MYKIHRIIKKIMHFILLTLVPFSSSLSIKLLQERAKMPAKVRKVYNQFGDNHIQEIKVFRQPIMTGIRELMKVITKKELRTLNYDELYHTGFIITLPNGSIRLERNDTVSSIVKADIPGDTPDLATMAIDLKGRNVTYSEFIDNAMKDDPNFWKYHPVTNNCQLFVLQCLEKNNFEISDKLRTFIYQDAEQILSGSPNLKQLSVSVTSLANRIGKAVDGVSDITIKNGTPYPIRVTTRYAGKNKFLKTCLSDDFVLEFGQHRTVNHGFCLLKEIGVAASLSGVDSIKNIPYKQLQEKADKFVQHSFPGKGKASAALLVRLTADNKLAIESAN